MSYAIAIPSYKRKALFEKNTYSLLKLHGLLHLSTVFVNTEDQSEYSELPDIKVVVRDCKSLVERRAFIYSYYPEGHHILQIDDDVSKVIDMTKKPVASLSDVIERGFRLATENDCYLWGVYPVANPFFMSEGYITKLSYIPGVMFGLIKKGEFLDAPEGKSDFYYSCWYYKRDGKTLRLQDVSPVANYYTASGGRLAMSQGRMEEENNGAKIVTGAFPEWASLYTRKRTGFPEVRLRQRKSTLHRSHHVHS